MSNLGRHIAQGPDPTQEIKLWQQQLKTRKNRYQIFPDFSFPAQFYKILTLKSFQLCFLAVF